MFGEIIKKAIEGTKKTVDKTKEIDEEVINKTKEAADSVKNEGEKDVAKIEKYVKKNYNIAKGGD